MSTSVLSICEARARVGGGRSGRVGLRGGGGGRGRGAHVHLVVLRLLDDLDCHLLAGLLVGAQLDLGEVAGAERLAHLVLVRDRRVDVLVVNLLHHFPMLWAGYEDTTTARLLD